MSYPHDRNLNPLHRVDAAQRAVYGKRVPSDPKIKALVDCINGVSTDQDLCYAWDKYQHPKSRYILNAFLLADATYDVMRQATEIPMSVLQAYANYIFDTSVFRDRLDRIEFIEATEQHFNPEEVRYYRAAMTVGSEYLIYLLNGQSTRRPKEVLRTLMLDSAFRAQEHRGAEIDSEVSRVSLQWAKNAQKTAAELHRLDPQDEQDAMEELRLALGFEDTTINETTKGAPRPEDILH